MKNQKVKIDMHKDTSSDLPGLLGMSERILKRFKAVAFFLALLPITVIDVFCIAFAATPGIYLWLRISPQLEALDLVWQALSYGFLLAVAYLSFAVSLIFIVPLFDLLLRRHVRPLRGNWYSLKVIPWYYHNALTQLVRYTVLDLMTPTPLTAIFYRAMGMKMGKNCIINTSNISDPCLIELGDYVTLGGSATLFAHYGMGGYLIVAKTKVGSYSTIGLKASLMGDVEVGENCNVRPHSILLPKTRLAKGESL